MWDHRARIDSVHDGDTIRVYQDDGREEFASLDVRLFGTFAPELNQLGGPEARDYAAAWVKARSVGDWPFVVQMIRNKSNTHEVTTFGRYVAMVYTADLTECLNVAVSAFVASKGYGGGTGSPTKETA